jgi:hypothetical protein
MVTSPRTVAARMANESLSNDTSVGELLRREATFLERNDLPADLYARGKEISHNALYTKCPTAFRAKERILPILLSTLEAIEELYEANAQQAAGGDDDDIESNTNTIITSRAKRRVSNATHSTAVRKSSRQPVRSDKFAMVSPLAVRRAKWIRKAKVAGEACVLLSLNFFIFIFILLIAFI